jgi:hypothetical protein
MNAVTSTVLERQADPSQLGEITAAWQVTPEALMVVGWRNEKSAAEGSVAHQRAASAKGRFHTATWSLAADAVVVHHFVAAMQLPVGSAVRPGETLVLHGKGEASAILARLPARFLDPEAFGVELARLAAGSAVAVTRFLTQTFSPPATRGNADIRAFMYAFLKRASSPDGCIEIAGSIDEQCVILQGWGAPPAPETELIAVGPSIERYTYKVASFARPDMRGTASGQVIVLPPTAARGLAQTEAVVVLDRRGLRWRPMVPDRQLLSQNEAISHLRSVLPVLQCDAATRAMLQANLRPRFDGRFTLHDAGHPVRLAIDLATGAPGAGIYLSGWLYDPAAVVAAVHLRGTLGASVRLDTTWARIARQDVTDAFRGDTTLPRPEANRDQHGFAAQAATCAATETFYLDISFNDGECGFAPLTITPVDRARLLASVDLHKPTGLKIVEDHLAPFFLRLASFHEKGPAIVAPVECSDWSTAIVVPLREATLPRSFLSQFLRDPLLRGEGVMFVCGENWGESDLAALRTLSAFYNIAPIILRVPDEAGPVSGILTAASACKARRFLLLDPSAVGRSAAWRKELQAALDAADAMTCVSPTVVYEDDSVRFAGTDGIIPASSAPYVTISRRLAGMPLASVAGRDAQPSATVNPACCLIPREVVDNIRQPAIAPASPSMQEAALSLLLRANGASFLWLPTGQIYAADVPESGIHENTARVGQMVDGWCLRARLNAAE